MSIPTIPINWCLDCRSGNHGACDKRFCECRREWHDG